MRHYRYLIVTAALLSLFSTETRAFELGKIDVASHLGDAFHAELPLTLDEGETLSKLSVELAAPDEYRDLGIYRDPAISLIRADLVRADRHGLIELSSRTPVNAPYLVILLKLRYGHATHFRKFPLFLDISRAAEPAEALSDNDRNQESLNRTAPETISEAAGGSVAGAFHPYDGWARIARYGPVIYGDILYVIADRLRIDERYTIRQVMVALFEKNRAKFEQDNLNNPLQGAYLEVPTAAEVEKRSYEQALLVIKKHDHHWRELRKQPHYAAIAEAQRTRYSKRARLAEEIKRAREASAWVESSAPEIEAKPSP